MSATLSPSKAAAEAKRRLLSMPLPGYSAPQVVAYIRCSTIRQAESEEGSPAQQVAAITAWTDRHGAEVAGIHFDIGVSGRVEPALRVGLQDALGQLRVLGPGAQLVVARRDRLSRLSLNAALIERDAERMGCTVTSCDAGSTGDGPTDRLVKHILDGVAEHAVALTRQRIQSAMLMLREKGIAVGRAPYGWAYATHPDATGHRPLVEVQEEQANIR